MPDYEIHDGETGMKLAVTGDEPPSPEVADVLMQKEFNDIKTNLFQLPGNKWYLDVGPLYKARILGDDPEVRKFQRESAAYHSAKEFADNNKIEGDKYPWSTWGANFKAQEARFNATNQIPDRPTVAESVLKNLPDGTLVITAHGGQKKKDLQTEWGHDFTMHNLRALLGDSANGISNIVNTACYGASCGPKDYADAFPSVQSIQHINTNYSNNRSLNDARAGRFFSAPGVKWTLTNGEWKPVDIPATTEAKE